MVVRRVPIPRSVIAKADIHAAGPIVAGYEPPGVCVEIPSRMHEHVVDLHCGAVPIHPEILPVAVVPISVHPDPTGARWDLLFDHDDLRRRRGLGARGDRLGFLDDHYGFSVDLLCHTALSLDDDVLRGIGCFAGGCSAAIAIVGHVELVGRSRRAVSARPLVIVCKCRSGKAAHDGEKKEKKPGDHTNLSFCLTTVRPAVTSQVLGPSLRGYDAR
jgi:hypothetical protein